MFRGWQLQGQRPRFPRQRRQLIPEVRHQSLRILAPCVQGLKGNNIKRLTRLEAHVLEPLACLSHLSSGTHRQQGLG